MIQETPREFNGYFLRDKRILHFCSFPHASNALVCLLGFYLFKNSYICICMDSWDTNKSFKGDGLGFLKQLFGPQRTMTPQNSYIALGRWF